MTGCCVDAICTPQTCMMLPEGTCRDCTNAAWCTKVYGVNPDSRTCDFFPRRFVRKVGRS